MPGSKMDGIRSYSFTVSGVGILELEDTDFWLEYTASSSDDDRVELGVKLNAVWEHSDWDTVQGLGRRQYVEDRFYDIMWNYVGQRGVLTVDVGSSSESSFIDIKLLNASIELGEFNDLFEYSLEFGYPLSGQFGDAQIARSYEFASYGSTSVSNLFVSRSKEDRTVFKPIYRAAPIRVPCGPSLTTIKLSEIVQATTGITSLAKRQNAESKISTWIGRIGEVGTLKVDGASQGTCHLQNVEENDLSFPDSVVYSLVFVGGYGS